MSKQYRELLKIRRQRELSKTLIASRKKLQLDNARRQQADADKQLNAFNHYRTKKQQELYAENTDTNIDRKTLEKTKAKATELKQQQQQCVDTLQQATRQALEQEEQLQAARVAQLEQVRQVKKFEFLVEKDDKEQRKRTLQREERESDDLPPTSPE